MLGLSVHGWPQYVLLRRTATPARTSTTSRWPGRTSNLISRARASTLPYAGLQRMRQDHGQMLFNISTMAASISPTRSVW